MKKIVWLYACICCLAFASCNTPSDDNTRSVEEKEDKAQKAADQMEDAAEDHDTTAVEIQQ